MPEQGWKRLTAGGPWFRGRRQVPHRRLFRVHAAAAAGTKSPTTATGNRRRVFDAGRSLGLADQRVRRGVGIAAGPAARGRATARRAAPLGPRRAGPRHRPQQAARQSLLARGASTQRARPRRNATCCCCRWPFRAPRTTRAASAGRSSAPAKQGPGRAFWRGLLSPPRGANCPPTGRSASSAGCWRPPIEEPPAGSADLAPRRAADLLQPGLCPAAAMGRRSRCPRWTEPLSLAARGNRSAASAIC